jgi:hypothetical protein
MKGQYDQTRGIPIGPDTSFITSEIILSALDIDLCSQMSLNGFRHHDDYEFGFDNFRSAEQCLSILRDVARKYELHLNPTKTHIIELPYLLEFNWASELLNYSFENNRKGKARALINYFDKAFIHASQYERSNVLNLSLAHLDTLINEEFWINEGERNLIVDFTLQCMSVDSSTLHKGIKILTNFHQRGHELNFLPVDSVLNDQIVSSSLSDSANQIAWSIWALLFFGIPISASAIKAISKMQDSVVALLALDAESRGFTCDKIDKSYWTQLLEGDCLHESLWLLAYESCKHGWIDFGARNPITENEQFTALLSHDVSFYNTEKVWCAVGVGETINDDELFLPLSTSFFY